VYVGKERVVHYTDANIVYTIMVFNVGKVVEQQVSMYGCKRVSNRYLVVAVPKLQLLKASKDAKNALIGWKKKENATLEDFEEFKAILEKYKDCLEVVDFEYLEEKNIRTDRDIIKKEIFL
jgi:hypothetical protein